MAITFILFEGEHCSPFLLNLNKIQIAEPSQKTPGKTTVIFGETYAVEVGIPYSAFLKIIEGAQAELRTVKTVKITNAGAVK